MKRFDVQFDDELNSVSEGFAMSRKECYEYIQMYNGTDDGYFGSFQGGIVSIVNVDTGECVYQARIKKVKKARCSMCKVSSTGVIEVW